MNKPATKADVLVAQFIIMSMVSAVWWISLACLFMAIFSIACRNEN